jgi:hypothetical protein
LTPRRGAQAPFSCLASSLIDERNRRSSFLRPGAVQNRLVAEAEALQAPCPPDVSGDRWETALDGLRTFIAPWLVSDRKVVGITPDATRTSTSHPNTDPSRCACGGRPETADGVLLPIGVGLHDDCWTHAAGERTWSK